MARAQLDKDPADVAGMFDDVAGRYDLIVTGSSDYHGDGKPNRLGENTTAPDQLDRIVDAATGWVPVRG